MTTQQNCIYIDNIFNNKKKYRFQNIIRRVNKTKDKIHSLFFEKYFAKHKIKFQEKTKVQKSE